MLLSGICGFLDFVFQLAIDQGIDAANEETCHAGHATQVAALFGKLFQARDVGFRHALVNILGEQQCDVDIDALADELLESRYAFLCAGDFNHGVRAAHQFPQSPSFIQSFLRFMREIRRYLEAHVTIAAFRLFVNLLKGIGRVLNVFHREDVENRLWRPDLSFSRVLPVSCV